LPDTVARAGSKAEQALRRWNASHQGTGAAPRLAVQLVRELARLPSPGFVPSKAAHDPKAPVFASFRFPVPAAPVQVAADGSKSAEASPAPAGNSSAGPSSSAPAPAPASGDKRGGPATRRTSAGGAGDGRRGSSAGGAGETPETSPAPGETYSSRERACKRPKTEAAPSGPRVIFAASAAHAGALPAALSWEQVQPLLQLAMSAREQAAALREPPDLPAYFAQHYERLRGEAYRDALPAMPQPATLPRVEHEVEEVDYRGRKRKPAGDEEEDA